MMNFNRVTQFGLSTLLWVASSVVGIYLASLNQNIVFVGDAFIPSDPDCFYHARRILDAVADLSSFYQFDSRIFAPEGGAIDWPWGYDFTLAVLVKVILATGAAGSGERILAWLPPFAIAVNLGLILVILHLLKVHLPGRVVTVAAFVLSPMFVQLHALGRVDHHFIELTFVLAILLAGLDWSIHRNSPRKGAVLGLLCGASVGFHHGLFLLQVPVGVWLFLLWIRDVLPARDALASFAIVLCVTTLLVSLPSPQLRGMEFSIYYLSWFHVFVAFVSAFIVLYYAFIRYSMRSLLLLVCTGLLVLVVIMEPLMGGVKWMGAELVMLNQIGEAESLMVRIGRLGWSNIFESYSFVVLLAPVVVGLLLMASRDSDTYLFLAVFSCFALTLGVLQIRFHYYGVPALLISSAAMLHWVARRFWSGRSWLVWHAAPFVLFLGLSASALPELLVRGNIIGGTLNYHVSRQIYAPLAKRCEERPGVVLSDFENGHFIRYHTQCSVISNPMIFAPLEEEKVLLSERLLANGPEYIRDNVGWVRYVLVRRSTFDFRPNAPSVSQTERRLLSSDEFPKGFNLVHQATVTIAGNSLVYARLFEIDDSFGGRGKK